MFFRISIKGVIFLYLIKLCFWLINSLEIADEWTWA